MNSGLALYLDAGSNSCSDLWLISAALNGGQLEVQSSFDVDE